MGDTLDLNSITDDKVCNNEKDNSKKDYLLNKEANDNGYKIDDSFSELQGSITDTNILENLKGIFVESKIINFNNVAKISDSAFTGLEGENFEVIFGSDSNKSVTIGKQAFGENFKPRKIFSNNGVTLSLYNDSFKLNNFIEAIDNQENNISVKLLGKWNKADVMSILNRTAIKEVSADDGFSIEERITEEELKTINRNNLNEDLKNKIAKKKKKEDSGESEQKSESAGAEKAEEAKKEEERKAAEAKEKEKILNWYKGKKKEILTAVKEKFKEEVTVIVKLDFKENVDGDEASGFLITNTEGVVVTLLGETKKIMNDIFDEKRIFSSSLLEKDEIDKIQKKSRIEIRNDIREEILEELSGENVGEITEKFLGYKNFNLVIKNKPDSLKVNNDLGNQKITLEESIEKLRGLETSTKNLEGEEIVSINDDLYFSILGEIKSIGRELKEEKQKLKVKKGEEERYKQLKNEIKICKECILILKEVTSQK